MSNTKNLTIAGNRRRAMSEPEIRHNLKHLITTIDKSWVQICALLHKVYSNRLFTVWGYEKFEDYCLKELGMRYRTSMIHQQIGETIDLHDLDEGKIGEIGWSKFKHLTYLINEDTTEEDLEKMFKKVKDMSLEEVKDYVWKIRSKGRVQKRQAVKFSLIPDQIEVWEATRQEIFRMSGIEDPSRQFEFLCINFGLHHNPVETEVILEKLSPEEEKIKLARKRRADKKPPMIKSEEALQQV